jgi:putative flippase GtrA
MTAWAYLVILGRVRSPLRLLRHRIFAELAAFGLVGGVCLGTDIVLFNVLAFGVGMSPVVAKSLTMLVTATIAFLGHRTVTFRHRRGRGLGHEILLFAAVTAGSLVAGLAPIWVVRNLAGMGSLLWLNAANLVGIAMGTVVRYLAYRHLVWPWAQLADGTVPPAATTPIEGSSGR